MAGAAVPVVCRDGAVNSTVIVEPARIVRIAVERIIGDQSVVQSRKHGHGYEMRERAAAEETSMSLPVEEQELARVVQKVEAKMSTPDSARANAAEIWKRQRLERVLGFGATSPDEGFGGSSRPA